MLAQLARRIRAHRAVHGEGDGDAEMEGAEGARTRLIFGDDCQVQ